VVYRAQQTALDRPIALKVLKAAVDLTAAQTADFQQTFAAEAQTIARLRHPNIVDVYDFGSAKAPSGTVVHWIALEWLEGRSLDAFLEERRTRGDRPFDPTSALHIVRPVFQAIAFAHRERVAHRDLKPDNIFLVESQGAIVPKVLDFGIAKIMVGNDGIGTQTTRGLPAFSPEYAAPSRSATAARDRSPTSMPSGCCSARCSRATSRMRARTNTTSKP
jgi:serine/threonine protein kinase